MTTTQFTLDERAVTDSIETDLAWPAIGPDWRPGDDSDCGSLHEAEELLATATHAGAITSPPGMSLGLDWSDGEQGCGYRWMVTVNEHTSEPFALAGVHNHASEMSGGPHDSEPGIPAALAVLREAVHEANELLDRAAAFGTWAATPVPIPPRVAPVAPVAVTIAWEETRTFATTVAVSPAAVEAAGFDPGTEEGLTGYARDTFGTHWFRFTDEERDTDGCDGRVVTHASRANPQIYGDPAWMMARQLGQVHGETAAEPYGAVMTTDIIPGLMAALGERYPVINEHFPHLGDEKAGQVGALVRAYQDAWRAACPVLAGGVTP